jgi:hypothetical protein
MFSTLLVSGLVRVLAALGWVLLPAHPAGGMCREARGAQPQALHAVILDPRGGVPARQPGDRFTRLFSFGGRGRGTGGKRQ